MEVVSEPVTETITFSTLSKEEKVRYFNYFLDNDITFQKEPKGTYIAEIQLLGEAEKTEEKPKDVEEPKSASPNKPQKKDYEILFAKVLKVLNPLVGIKGSKMDMSILRYLMEEIYSLRFLKDTQILAKQEDAEPESFPLFVGNFLITKYTKKSTLDQQTINFLTSIEFYSRTNRDIKLFSKFLSEEYDVDDLIFYLFVRSCIEKELKVFFLEKAKENMRNANNGYEDSNQNEIYVPVKSCKKIGLSVFGSDEQELLNSFLEKIKNLSETESLNNKKTMIKASSILLFAVDDYHQSRNGDEEEEKNVTEFEGNDEEEEVGGDLKRQIAVNGTCSKEFKTILTKNKAEKAQNEAEKKAVLKKVISDYTKIKELEPYFKKLLNSNPVFEGVNEKMSKSILNVKEMALKKINVMTGLVFSGEKGTFLNFLKLKESDAKGNKTFSTLFDYADQMVKTQNLSDLDESNVIMFIRTIFEIPEFNIQISKLLLKNVE